MRWGERLGYMAEASEGEFIYVRHLFPIKINASEGSAVILRIVPEWSRSICGKFKHTYR